MSRPKQNQIELQPYGQFRIYVSRVTGSFMAYAADGTIACTHTSLAELKELLTLQDAPTLDVPVVGISLSGHVLAEGSVNGISYGTGCLVMNGVSIQPRSVPDYLVHAHHPEIGYVKHLASLVNDARRKLDEARQELEGALSSIGVAIKPFVSVRPNTYEGSKQIEKSLATDLGRSLDLRSAQ